MSLQDDLASVQRSLDDLVRCVGRVEQQTGSGLDVRRVRTDADHLRQSVALLRASVAQSHQALLPRPDLVSIPDTPYDSALWKDAEDEGLGACDRRAP